MMILWQDILKRKIPNNHLGILVLILPFWYLVFPIYNTSIMIGNILLASLLLIFGVFLYKKGSFLGAWDIKYGALLIVFLWDNSAALFIGNIGVITACTLLFWWSMLVWQIFSLEPSIFTQSPWKKILNTLQPTIIKNIVLGFLFDWIGIGFFLYLVTQDGINILFQSLPYSNDYYFLIFVIIVFIRPYFRYLLQKWEHRIFPLAFMWLYFISKVENTGIDYILSTLQIFIENIWIYALWFSIVSGISRKIFKLYDDLDKKNIVYSLHSLHYSTVIFIAFVFAYFFEFSLMNWIGFAF